MSEQVLTDFEIVQILKTDRPKTGWAYGLCREVEAKVVSRCRAQGGNTSDNITQAAANKAAEEGEMTFFLSDIYEICDEYAKFFASKERGDMSGAVYQVKSRFQHLASKKDAIAADRASRQVANKAEVEPVTQVHLSDSNWMDVPVSEVPTWKRKGFETRTLYVTPPATTGGANATPTGASTVLTDERKPLGYARFRAAQRITADGDVDANEWYEFCEPHDIGDDKMPAFPVYDKPVREVAAQAGQVAVPEYAFPTFEHWLASDIETAPHGLTQQQKTIGYARLAFNAGRASPAKESK